jgi:hypothetical protein
VRKFLREEPGIQKVIFACFGREAHGAYQAELAKG